MTIENSTNNLNQRVYDLEELNKKIENSDSEEERKVAWEAVEKIELELDELEKEFGLNTDELIKVYENMNIAEAQWEIKDSVPEDIKAEIKLGKLDSYKTWLASLNGMKKMRMAACFLFLSMGVNLMSANFNIAQATSLDKAGEQFRHDWKQELKELQELKKYSSDMQKYSDEDLEKMAKSQSFRLDKFFEIEEKKIKIYQLYLLKQKLGNNHIESYKYDRHKREWVKDRIHVVPEGKKNVSEKNQSSNIQNKISKQKKIISSGDGADPDAW